MLSVHCLRRRREIPLRLIFRDPLKYVGSTSLLFRQMLVESLT